MPAAEEVGEEAEAFEPTGSGSAVAGSGPSMRERWSSAEGTLDLALNLGVAGLSHQRCLLEVEVHHPHHR
jgi:hypothetical protein